MLCTGEIQILPQNFQQRLVRCEGDFRVFAVESETNMFLTVELHRLFSLPCSKSCCRSVAFCRRMPQARRGLAGRRVSRFSPASLHLQLLCNPAGRVVRIQSWSESI